MHLPSSAMFHLAVPFANNTQSLKGLSPFTFSELCGVYIFFLCVSACGCVFMRAWWDVSVRVKMYYQKSGKSYWCLRANALQALRICCRWYALSCKATGTAPAVLTCHLRLPKIGSHYVPLVLLETEIMSYCFGDVVNSKIYLVGTESRNLSENIITIK